jgi:hypothetical protein
MIPVEHQVAQLLSCDLRCGLQLQVAEQHPLDVVTNGTTRPWVDANLAALTASCGNMLATNGGGWGVFCGSRAWPAKM